MFFKNILILWTPVDEKNLTATDCRTIDENENED